MYLRPQVESFGEIEDDACDYVVLVARRAGEIPGVTRLVGDNGAPWKNGRGVEQEMNSELCLSGYLSVAQGKKR